MSASFIDRVCANGDYAEDGGPIDMLEAWSAVDCWHSGQMTAAQIKSQYSMTSQQGDEFDAIMATRPELLGITLVSEIIVESDYAQWPGKVKGALMQGLLKKSGGMYETSSEVRVKLGLSA